MTVSLLEILAAARAHAAPLAAESAGYLLLAVADHVAAAPRGVMAEDVELADDGTVRLRASRGSAEPEAGVELGVRTLLSRALEVSSSVGPALRRAGDRSRQAGLGPLVRELESALIPVNRAAAKRALSRLHRETARARDAGKLAALLNAEVTPERAPASARPVGPEAPPVVSEFHEPAPTALPVVAPVPTPAPRAIELAPPPRDLTPEPVIAAGEAALTRPEPVVQRRRERGNRTPQLGTLVIAQTGPEEETELTERAPCVDLAEVDPDPSRLPDVLTAMVELHTGLDADEAPTRLRDVVVAPVPSRPLESVAETEADEDLVTPRLAPASVKAEHSRTAGSTEAPVETGDAEDAPVENGGAEEVWLGQSSLEAVVTSPRLFESERADPALHEAVTWNPGPVEPASLSSLPATVLIGEPAPEPSPCAPAALPTQSRDVSELVEAFHVSAAADERELRSALKEMAGLSLTPMPHSSIEKR